MKLRFLMTPLVFLAFLAADISAAPQEDGESLFRQKGCISCHGPQGDQPTASNYPKLKGQNKDYIVQQVKDIKSGKRGNALTAVMKPIVSGLTDSEIEAIAEYLSSLSTPSNHEPQ